MRKLISFILALGFYAGAFAQPSFSGFDAVSFDPATNNEVMVPTGVLRFGDDFLLEFGAGGDYWLTYDSATGRLQIWSTNTDGAGADGELVRIADGTDNLTLLGDLILNKETANEWLKLDGSKQVVTAIPNADDLGDVVVSSPQTGQVFRYNGSNWVNAEISIDDVGDNDVTAIIIDTAGNRPAAGTANRLFIASDTGKIQLDNGASWDNIFGETDLSLYDNSTSQFFDTRGTGIGGSGTEITATLGTDISIGELDFDTATQAELDTHEATSNAHHTRPSAGVGLTENSNAFDVDLGTDIAPAELKEDDGETLADGQVPTVDNTNGEWDFIDQGSGGGLDADTVDGEHASAFQDQGPRLDEIAGITPSDGQFIVGNGSGFVGESGNTARTSLGVGTGDSPTFTGATLSGVTASTVAVFDGSKKLVSSSISTNTLHQIPNALAGRAWARAGAQFDGSNDYIQVANADEFTFSDGTDDLPFSLAAWVRIDDVTSSVILTKGTNSGNSEYRFSTSSSEDLIIVLYTDGSNFWIIDTVSAYTTYEGRWANVCVTYGGSGPNSASSFANADSEVELYINGESIPTTSTQTGTYAGMTAGSQPLKIGSWNTLFTKGSIRDVQIFNRELSASEVRSLYQEGVSFADKDGGALGGFLTYDFSGGDGGFTTSTGGTVSGNVDGISDGSTSKDNVLRFTADASSGGHNTADGAIFSLGKKFMVQLEYFIPSGQSNIDGIKLGSGGSTSLFGNEVLNTAGTWTFYRSPVSTISSGSLSFNLVATDGGSTSFQDAGGDDVFYVTNLKITQVGAVLDLPLDENIGYQAHDRTSNNNHGAFSATDGPQWIHTANRGKVIGLGFSGNSTILQPALAGATLPPHALIESIVIRETSGANPAAPYISTTAGDKDTTITLGRDIGASEIRSLGIIDTLPGGASSEELFINQDGSWAGSLNVTINYSTYE